MYTDSGKLNVERTNKEKERLIISVDVAGRFSRSRAAKRAAAAGGPLDSNNPTEAGKAGLHVRF